MEVSDPAPVSTDEDVPLFVKAGRFGSLEHHPLIEDFHGVDSLCLAEFHDANLAESSPTDHFDDIEIIPAQSKIFDLRYSRFH